MFFKKVNLNGNAKCKRKRKKRVLKRIESFQSNRIYNQARESEQRDFHFSVQRSCDFYPGRSFFKVCSTFFLNKFPKKEDSVDISNGTEGLKSNDFRRFVLF